MAEKKTPEGQAPMPQKAEDQQASKKPAQEEGFDKARMAWAKGQLDKATAHAERFFEVDDDLPISQHLLLVFVVLFFVVFVFWANFASLDEVTRGDGRVIPSSQIQVLQSLEGGIIDSFLVREGDEVEAGQPVLQLRDVQASSDLGANESRFLSLKAKIQRLKAESEGLDAPEFSEDVMKGVPQSVREELEVFRANISNVRSQTQVLEEQVIQREQELKETRTRVSDLAAVLRISREERSMLAPLVNRGSAPKMELLQIERGIKEQQTQLNSAQGSIPRLEASINEARARIEELESSLRAQAQAELAATTAEMNSIAETLTALQDRKTRTEIKSPVNGFVKEIKIATVGGVVQPGADLIEIVPKDDQLIVEARIRPADIAFLYPGQEAVVKITAYDYSIYGGLNGELVSISADTIENEEGETFYRVRIRTPENTIKRNGQVLDIIPGMVASVDILTGKKTVMEYILKPFIKTLDNSLSER